MNIQTSLSAKHLRAALKFLLIGLLVALLILYVLNASIPGRMVLGCLDGCSAPMKRQVGPLRVVSLNMLHGFPLFLDLDERLSLIAAEIKRLDADIVLLQEVPWTRSMSDASERLSKALGYNHLYLRANGNRKLIFFEEGEAILTRFPLADVVYKELVPRVDMFQHRVVLGATALTPWGDLRVFVTHLTHSDPQANVGQVADLQAFVEAHTAGMGIVAGDFNERDNSPEIAGLSTAWTDTYCQAHPDDAGFTCCIDNLHSGPGEALEMRIDYVFLVHPAWKLISADHAFYDPLKAGDGWQWVSDHTGLIVELEP